jgi:hypothetical protein
MKLHQWRPLVYTFTVAVIILAVVAMVEDTGIALACLLVVAAFGLGLIALLSGAKFRFGCRVLGLFSWIGKINS